MPTLNDPMGWYDDSNWENSDDAHKVNFLNNDIQWRQYDEDIRASNTLAHDVATQFWMGITTKE